MRSLAAFALILLLQAYPSYALADNAASAGSAPAPQATLMKSAANNCAATHYPALAVRLNHQGATTFTVHIDETGKATAVDIAQSSGFNELDEAGKECVLSAWHFSPATMNGKPVASTKQYRIIWKLMGESSPPHLLASMEASCADIFGDAKARWTSYQSATLQFRVSSTGTVIFPFVAVSSGDTLFDAKAVQCMTRLKYGAAIYDNTPIDLSWSAAVRWSPHTGLAYTDRYRITSYCKDDQFPPDLWKGDPPNSTVISFHIVQDGVLAGAAIERSSGNPALDQAALKCVQEWRNPYIVLLAGLPDVADVVRFTWRQGHAFILDDIWN
ncbi:MAG TPA: TonB family protein [Rhizomicrobium sp.]|jgi:TonB family protein